MDTLMSTTAGHAALLSAERISLVSDKLRILEEVSLEAPPGSFTALIGPNGAGKSSLLAVLSGLRAPTAGSVRLRGSEIGVFSPQERAKLCAVMRQDGARPSGLTVLEAVELGRMSTGGSGARAMAWDALEKNELVEIADRDCAYLSGGEWQRAAFARTILQLESGSQPGVLLLDEPVSHLDPLHQHRLLSLARGLAENGHAVLAVLHDLNLTRRYAHRVVLLKAGRVAGAGKTAEMMKPDTLGALYDCPVAVVAGTGGDLDVLVTLPPEKIR